jgi:hypothetical protein
MGHGKCSWFWTHGYCNRLGFCKQKTNPLWITGSSTCFIPGLFFSLSTHGAISWISQVLKQIGVKLWSTWAGEVLSTKYFINTNRGCSQSQMPWVLISWIQRTICLLIIDGWSTKLRHDQIGNLTPGTNITLHDWFKVKVQQKEVGAMCAVTSVHFYTWTARACRLYF